MFKTDTDYVFDQFADSVNSEYKLSNNDIVTFNLFTNQGARLLELTAGSGEKQILFTESRFTYTVDLEGRINFPEIGKIEVAGLTIYELQENLEERYSHLYKDPYAKIDILNNRVIVFPGSGGDAWVITLVNQNTTVIEALALAGGITERGDASKVKLIRRINEEEEVYLMDLSTIEGIQYAGMIVQANDLIYVEPTPQLASELLKDISPIVTIVSGIALIVAIFSQNF